MPRQTSPPAPAPTLRLSLRAMPTPRTAAMTVSTAVTATPHASSTASAKPTRTTSTALRPHAGTRYFIRSPITVYSLADTEQAYSCQYQALVRQYFSICPSAVNPPFWPAPANAPGACSCNYGQVWDYIRKVGNEQVACYNDAIRSANGGRNMNDVVRQESGCACCGASGIYSACVPALTTHPHHGFDQTNRRTQYSIHHLCPNVSPSLLFPFPNGWPFPFPSSSNFPIPSNLPIPSPPISLPGGVPLPLPSPLPGGLPIPSDISAWAWSSCQATLGNLNCPNLGFANPPGGRFYAPDDLPRGSGTVTVSDQSGTVRVPPSGTMFSWGGNGNTYTVTAQGVRVTETGANGNPRVTGVFSTDTGTGALPTITQSKGAVVAGRIGEKVVAGVVVGLGVCVVCSVITCLPLLLLD